MMLQNQVKNKCFFFNFGEVNLIPFFFYYTMNRLNNPNTFCKCPRESKTIFKNASAIQLLKLCKS